MVSKNSQSSMPPRRLLEHLFESAVASVAAHHCLPQHLPQTSAIGRTLVLGAGKAAAAMAQTVAQSVPGRLEGLVVTRYGHTVDEEIPGITVIEAAHPVPDEMSLKAASDMLALASSTGPNDRLIFLASGGGSSVLALPIPGLDFTKKRELMRHLVLCGAPISDINTVRKHVSAIKGGRLLDAARYAGEVLTLVISDVPGDDPALVASGPTIPDPSRVAKARAVIERWGAPDREEILDLLRQEEAETPKSAPCTHRIIVAARAADCLSSAYETARSMGLDVVDLGDRLEGVSAQLGQDHARLALKAQAQGRPTLILSGGETTVQLDSSSVGGCGGPNLEYLLGMMLELKGAAGIYALACDSDGIDGNGDHAGGIIEPQSLERARALGLDPAESLKRHDSYKLFKALGDLIVTGPTRTNVNDFRAILVEPVADRRVSL
ncbi:glycerate kinase type-2 family protein [Iodidimonas gelatinilytica]|nr:glycerate kinase [Iodidimonas gelatinilytica]